MIWAKGPPPVLAVCGYSGSGKTTLLESVVPRLLERGLEVAVIKHDAHRVDIDRPGKDSDRLFRAGADVVLRSSEESMLRWHKASAPNLAGALRLLADSCDLVLVEGHKATSLPKLWLLAAGEVEPPPDVDGVLEVLPWGEPRLAGTERAIIDYLTASWEQRPIIGGVLVGGQSSRMGRPKQLLEHGGRSLVEGLVDALRSVVGEVVFLGEGELPAALDGMPRVSDPPGLEGPIAGLLGALRWCPEAAWLVASCDLPSVTSNGLRWLLDQRSVGNWAVLPRLEGGRVEPLFALYEPQSRSLLERLVASGSRAPRLLADGPKTVCPAPPAAIVGQWIGVNTPEEYDALHRRERR